MDFFERQDNARRRTRTLVLYFTAAVVSILLAVYLIVALAFGAREAGELWNPELFLWVSLGTLGVVSAGSVTKIAQLSQGGSSVAAMLGGRSIDSNTTDLDERKLLNVVEEMAIASGVPVPEIYVLDDEDSINAFAAGYTPGDAAVGVTRGCMRLLDRDELQGVIAHEFSHILNGDMRLNVRLIGLLNGILCLAIVGRMLLYSGGRSARHSRRGGKGGGGGILLIGLGLLLVGSIGIFFGKLIKSAISRQREFLADAAAVQFTRNPSGLAGALKKIGGLVQGSRIQSPSAEEASHLFFGNGMGQSIFGWFSTHPPLKERIQAIDPSFDGSFPKVSMPEAAAQPRKARPPLAPVPRMAASGLAGAAPGHGISIQAPPVIASVGQPSKEHLSYAAALLDGLPEELRAAAHEPFGACALIYCLLLSPERAARTGQLQQLQKRAHPGVFHEVNRILPQILDLTPRAKLPLVDLSLPALRHVSPEQYERFKGNVRFIIESDRQIDLFEYALERVIRRHLEPHFSQVPPTVAQFHGLQPLLRDCGVVLSALAHLGHADAPATQAAFRAGVAALGPDGTTLPLLELEKCSLEQIDLALNRLAQASLPVKKRILHAMIQTVVADKTVQVREGELLRAVADSLDCPLPPLLSATEEH